MRDCIKIVALISTFTAICMTSCTNEIVLEDHAVTETASVEEIDGEHHIPLSDALAHLESMLNAFDSGQTRAHHRDNWSIQRVPMSTFKSQTRSNDDLSGDALYVVNFENDGGYAILSADDRLPDNVIAVTSSGNLNFEPIPFDDTTDTLTLDMLYVAEDDDYLLGNREDGFVQDLVANYVLGWTDSLPGMEDEFGDIPISDITYSYEYETTVNYPEMITTQWDQGSPYNDFCPNRHYYYGGLFHTKKSAIKEYYFDPIAEWGDDYISSDDLAAGCVAIATAQIIAYNKYPDVKNLVAYEQPTMTWDDIAMEYSHDERHARHLGKLVHSVGVGCKMDYGFFKKQSFATPINAKRYLNDIGYTNTQRHTGFDLNLVINQIQNDCPVFIGAISGLTNGHAWVIDGYKQIKEFEIGTTPEGVVVNRRVVRTNHYLHFNWGWGGTNDGWFTTNLTSSQSFSPNDASSYDGTSSSESNYTFDWWFRLVTYDKPQND